MAASLVAALSAVASLSFSSTVTPVDCCCCSYNAWSWDAPIVHSNGAPVHHHHLEEVQHQIAAEVEQPRRIRELEERVKRLEDERSKLREEVEEREGSFQEVDRERRECIKEKRGLKKRIAELEDSLAEESSRNERELKALKGQRERDQWKGSLPLPCSVLALLFGCASSHSMCCSGPPPFARQRIVCVP